MALLAGESSVTAVTFAVHTASSVVNDRSTDDTLPFPSLATMRQKYVVPFASVGGFHDLVSVLLASGGGDDVPKYTS